MERFIRTDTASVELFFTIFISGIEIFVIPWDQLLYPVSQKSAPWNWNYGDNHLRLIAIPKTLTLSGQAFLEVEEKMGITGREMWAIGWMMIKHLPAGLLQEMC